MENAEALLVFPMTAACFTAMAGISVLCRMPSSKGPKGFAWALYGDIFYPTMRLETPFSWFATKLPDHVEFSGLFLLVLLFKMMAALRSPEKISYFPIAFFVSPCYNKFRCWHALTFGDRMGL